MTTTPPSADELATWLTGRIDFYGQVAPGSYTLDTPLAELGLDSIYAMSLCADIEDTYGLPLDPTVFEEYPTLRELSHGLVSRIAA
jgi:acyl carrier protein